MTAVGLFFNGEAVRRMLFSSSESFMELGLLMRKGVSMAEALHSMSRSARSSRLTKAANLAARRLSSGESSEKVFAGKDMAVFPPEVRYILAAPLQDTTRGMLIVDLQLRPATGLNFESSLTYPVFSMCFGTLTILALYMFVFPQMREIFLGLRIEGGPFISWILEICGSSSLIHIMLFVALFVGVLCLAVFLTRRLTSFSKMTDEMRLLRMLAAVPPEQRLSVADIMSVKVNFPLLHASFRRMTRGIADGKDVATAGREAGVSDGLTWFMALGLQDQSAESQLLLQASDYYNARINHANEKTITMLEVASTLFLSSTFGALTYALMQMMNAICLGTMQ